MDESQENLIKSWEILKKLTLEEDQREKILVREEQLKKWVMDARIEDLNLISGADLESTIHKCSKGTESGRSDSKHLKQENIQNLNVLETSGYLHVSDRTSKKLLYPPVLISISMPTS